MVTAELAVGLPVVVLTAAIAAAGIGLAAADLRCVATASVAARMAARGDDPAAVRASVAAQAPQVRLTLTRDGQFVVAEASTRARVPALGRLLPSITVHEQVEQLDETGAAAAP